MFCVLWQGKNQWLLTTSACDYSSDSKANIGRELQLSPNLGVTLPHLHLNVSPLFFHHICLCKPKSIIQRQHTSYF